MDAVIEITPKVFPVSANRPHVVGIKPVVDYFIKAVNNYKPYSWSDYKIVYGKNLEL